MHFDLTRHRLPTPPVLYKSGWNVLRYVELTRDTEGCK